MPESVTLDAPAKVNLRLRVLAREVSGYHSLETVFCAVSLCDRVEVRRARGGVRLRVAGEIDTGPPEDNLVVRAARAFADAAGVPPEAEILLRKRIPAGAGLGGGSSDAASTLRALNRLHDQPLDRGRLLEVAGGLGSDVPFFLCGSTLALGWGHGERLLALPPLPRRSVLLAWPPRGRSTRMAYEKLSLDPRAAARAEVLSADELSSWEGVAALAANDFAADAVEYDPGTGTVLDALRDHGATVALLSGSGAAVFGIFADAERSVSAAVDVEAARWTTVRAETLSVPPRPQVDPGRGGG